MSTNSPSNQLSPAMQARWPNVEIRHLVRASQQFIVWIDTDGDIDWKTSDELDADGDARARRSEVRARATVLETVSFAGLDPGIVFNYKRHIAEGLAHSFDGDFNGAIKLLDHAEQYFGQSLSAHNEARATAVDEYATILRSWGKARLRWTVLHYVVGITALLCSSIVAAKFAVLQAPTGPATALPWLVAFLTGLLTFLGPEKKAERYARAWVSLNEAVALYRMSQTAPIDTVLRAHRDGQAIITDGKA